MAIVSHKGLAAYALGSSIVDSDVRWAVAGCWGGWPWLCWAVGCAGV